MIRRFSIALAFVAAVLTAGVTGWTLQKRTPERSFDQKRLALLQSEVDRLRAVVEEKARSEAAPDLAARRGEIERAVEEIRGLKFLKPVKYAMLSRSEIEAVLHGKLSETLSDEEFEHMALGFSALGLLEPGYPLKEKYIDLLGEQVAAFYDQHTHTLYMFEDASLENAQNRVILAHELTHALQDQHFSLEKLPLEIKHDDDRAVAASALVEGEATAVMTDFLLRNLSWQTMRDSISGMVMQNMEQLQAAPPFLREMLLFPYLRGQEFTMTLQAQGGYEELTKAYGRLPASSAQILHPELYLNGVEPITVEWPDTLINGQSPVANNNLGEIGTRVLLAQHLAAETAESAANGWAGDRYLVYGNQKDWQLLWKTVWRTPRDAEEFAAALRQYVQKRYANGTPRVSRVEQGEENSVVWIDASTADWADTLAAKLK